MGIKKTTLLLVAVLVAVAGGVAAYLYLNGVQERANNDARLVEVLVVNEPIPKGTAAQDALSAGVIDIGSIPQQYRPATAVVDPTSLAGKVAAAEIAPGQIVVDNLFVDPRVANLTSAQKIPAGKVAVTISTNDILGNAGLIRPGDKVNIAYRSQLFGPDGNPLVPAQYRQAFLYQNVDVLFVGQEAAPDPGVTPDPAAPPAEPSGLITFAVPPEAALKIMTVSQDSPLYLTLVPPDHEARPVEPVTNTEVINENDGTGGSLTPAQDGPAEPVEGTDGN